MEIDPARLRIQPESSENAVRKDTSAPAAGNGEPIVLDTPLVVDEKAVMPSDTASQKAVKKDPGDSRLPASSEETDAPAPITLEDARQQIGEKILSVLAEKFNGKLSEVRPVDPKDMLF